MSRIPYVVTQCAKFQEGARYRIKHGTFNRIMRVDTVKDGFVRFVDVYDSRIKCSGELFEVQLPNCQSCNIDGCDMVFSYDRVDERCEY